MKDKPFLYLKENIGKLNIDLRLVPVLSELLDLMQEYFEEHGLLDCLNFKEVFDKYFINDSENKIKFVVNDDPNNPIRNCYLQEQKSIVLSADSLDTHSLCHEFIHALVWKGLEDSKEKKEVHASESFLDEGLTEYLARKITKYKPPKGISTYNENVEFGEFLEKLCGEKELFTILFSGKSLVKTFIGDDKNAILYLQILRSLKEYNSSQKFYQLNPSLNPKNNENYFKELEIYLIEVVLNNHSYKCETIEDLIKYAKIISSRPLECSGDIDYLYDEIIKIYLSHLSLDSYDRMIMATNLRNVLYHYDRIYTYGPNDYAFITLKAEDGDEIQVCIGKDYEPRKANLDVVHGTFNYVAHENSNSEPRKVYRAPAKQDDIDFDEDRKNSERAIRISLMGIFSINGINEPLIDELLLKYCNTSISSLNEDNIDYILGELKKSIDPILYSVVQRKLTSLFERNR